jgi:hypothetical protein
MTTTPPILPCPYCKYKKPEIDYYQHNGIKTQHWIHCSVCYAQSGLCKDETEAIESWNRIAADRTVKMPKYNKNPFGLDLYKAGYNQALSDVKKLNPNLKFEE